VQSGERDSNLLWTFELNVNHSDIVQPGYLSNTMQPKIDQLVQLAAAARIEVATFTTALNKWRNDYAERPSMYQRANTGAQRYFNVALNTQDFAYVSESAALVTRVLNLHESLNVPLDVFLTTTQVDEFEATNPGDTRNGLFLKPEHVDLKLFEYFGQDGTAAFVGVKMHDNDFFASQNTWTYVYQNGGRRRPNWDATRKPALLSLDDQAAMWTLYEITVRHAAALRDAGSIQLVDADDLIELSEAAR
jgi:hypothetical protein